MTPVQKVARESDRAPEPFIKVAHLWLSVILVIAGMFASAGGVVWSIAIFKSDTTNNFNQVGKKVDELAKKIGEVSDTAKESRDWILKRQGAEEADQARARGTRFGGVSIN